MVSQTRQECTLLTASARALMALVVVAGDIQGENKAVVAESQRSYHSTRRTVAATMQGLVAGQLDSYIDLPDAMRVQAVKAIACEHDCGRRAYL